MRIQIDISAGELVDFLSALSLSAEPPAKESVATKLNTMADNVFRLNATEYNGDEGVDFDPKRLLRNFTVKCDSR